MNDKGNIIGIDLGTTNSEAAYIKRGNKYPETIKNFQTDSDILPSVVGIDPSSNELIVGEEAKNGLIQNPNNFVKEIKRKMGSNEKIHIGNEELLPEEISAIILKYIKKYSEEATGEIFSRAVITVPANFDDNQRNATIKAGELAGFEVERIINEPTAAALAYGLNNKDNKHVMVFDLGGGTFDVTILEYNGEILDVKASAGNDKLGGSDFDGLLLDYISDEYLKIEGFDLRIIPKINNGLLMHEERKKELSFKHRTSLLFSSIEIGNGEFINIDMDITRTELKSLIKSKIDKTEKEINFALKKAKLKKKDIDTVLLVGGSTKIPYVKELVERVMGQEPKQDIDPDRSVALGAAIQGNIIDGKTDIIIMDRCALSFGTEILEIFEGKVSEGVYSEVMPSNTPFLTETKRQYITVFDNQESVDIKIYQKQGTNNSKWVQDMRFLAEKELAGIPPNKAGQEIIMLSFVYNLNGILDIKAVIESTEKSIEFKVKSQDIEIEKLKENIDVLWKKSEKAGKIKATIAAADKLLKKIGKNKELEDKILKLKEAVIKDDEKMIDELDDDVTDLIFDLQE